MIDKEIIAQINKLGCATPTKYDPLDRISSGSLILDEALNGGWGRGVFNLIKGPESAGKTHLAILALLSAKRMGFFPAIIDSEKKFNLEYAYRSGLGKPNEDYWYLPVECAEDAFNAARTLAKREETGLIVFDSWAALPPRAELEGEADDNTMGLFARKSGQFFRTATTEFRNGNCCGLIINQTRLNIGPYGGEAMPGGKPIRFYPAIAVALEKADQQYPIGASKEDIKAKKVTPIGITINGSLFKNNHGANFVYFETEIRFYPKLIVKRLDELVDLGKKYGILLKNDGTKIKSDTAIFHYNDEEIGKGKQEVCIKLRDNSELRESIEADLREKITNRTNVIEEEM